MVGLLRIGWDALLSGARLSRTLCALTLLTTLGLCLVATLTLKTLRDEAWDKADAASHNMLRLIEQDLARNIEMFDLSLGAVADGLKMSGLSALSPDLRHAVLFDRAASAKYLGAILVLDKDGDVLFESRTPATRTANYAARDYFQHHVAAVDPNLYISQPYLSSTTGHWVIGLSRRQVDDRGAFAGVIVGTMQLDYFGDLFAKLDLGAHGSASLFRRDGTLLMRRPFAPELIGQSLAATPGFADIVTVRQGTVTLHSVLDGIRRRVGFRRVGDLPLHVSVALSTDEILRDWWWQACVIGGVVAGLCSLTMVLNLLLLRELRRRAAVEEHLQAANERFARLALTDPLTGLGNRRLFDETLLRLWNQGRRDRRSVSLVMIDVDHFKAYNDRYGHGGGDAVLRRIAARLGQNCALAGCEPCRIGGEEFAVAFIGLSDPEAFGTAERLRSGVEGQAMPHAASPLGIVSVSVGVATVSPLASHEPGVLLEAADAALYRAKAGGRNRTATLGSGTLAEALVSIAARPAAPARPARRRLRA